MADKQAGQRNDRKSTPKAKYINTSDWKKGVTDV